ncbi:hypothetical protein Vi05172_g6294 [Venturia inaequalis]|nr:hypothetical protein Vi05172_g6294 [Venturia inaequalis]
MMNSVAPSGGHGHISQIGNAALLNAFFVWRRGACRQKLGRLVPLIQGHPHRTTSSSNDILIERHPHRTTPTIINKTAKMAAFAASIGISAVDSVFAADFGGHLEESIHTNNNDINRRVHQAEGHRTMDNGALENLHLFNLNDVM